MVKATLANARIWLILPALLGSSQVRAQEATALGPVSGEVKAQWTPPQPGQVQAVNKQAAQPAKVRVGLRLTPFKKVVTRHPDGTSDSQFVAGEALRHTLRARLNQPNHFYVGDWHVATVPKVWIQKTRRYEIELQIFKRYGAFGQLEESLGTVPLSGVLEAQPNNMHVLVGVARQRLRDKFGSPLLDVVAGAQSQQDGSATAAAFIPGRAPVTAAQARPAPAQAAATSAKPEARL